MRRRDARRYLRETYVNKLVEAKLFLVQIDGLKRPRGFIRCQLRCSQMRRGLATPAPNRSL